MQRCKCGRTITVTEAINNNSGTATVMGYTSVQLKAVSYQQTSPFTEGTNIGIADSPMKRM
jgi:hypothetical protein